MAYTYSGDPASSLTDRVRFLIQDTSDPGLITDSEVAWMLSEEGNGTYATAAALCLVIARKYAGKSGSRSIGDITISYGDLTKNYTSLAKMLTERADRSSVPMPYLGGLSRADKQANDANTDHVERAFGSDEMWSNEDGSRTGSGSSNVTVSFPDYGSGY